MDLLHNLYTQKLLSRFCGRLVGTDAQGNHYYEQKVLFGKRNTPLKRWVIYRDDNVEATTVPAPWFAWLHYIVETPLSTEQTYDWIKPHQQNLSGTPGQHLATNSILKDNPQEGVKKTYTAWAPANDKYESINET